MTQRRSGFAVLALAAAGATACTGSSAPTDPPAATHPPATSHASAQVQRTTDISIALLERQFALEPGIFANSTVEIEEAIGGHTVPPAVREAITKHFAGKVRVRWYLQHVFTPRDDVVDLRLPALPHGRRLLVS